MEDEAYRVIEDVEQLIENAIWSQLTNEQWFLDFLDKLNSLSVRF